MKKVVSQKLSLAVKVSLCLTAAFLMRPAADAIHSHFTDPSETQQMPSDWIKKPVKHPPSAGSPDLMVTLDQQMYPALMPIIKEYARKEKLKVVINEGTCGISAGMLSRKEVDIGGYCCASGTTDRLPGLKFHTLGIASLALLVHPDNYIDNVTIKQARDIFSGDIYRWSELKTSKGRKGPKHLIQPVARLHCKQRGGNWHLLLDDEDLFSANLREVGAIPDMITQVASNPRSVGYETLWMTRFFQKEGRVKVLKIDGHDPDKDDNLLSGKYSLYRVYSITTWEGEGVSSPLAMKLVNYLLQQAEHFDEKFSLVPASSLRKAGWKFNGNELVGEPEQDD
jgi:ABC-type phosphate transport system substrate-binding protein